MRSAPGIDASGRPVRLLLADPADLPPGFDPEGGRALAFAILRIGHDAIASRFGWYIGSMFAVLAFDGFALWAAGPLAMFLVFSTPIAPAFLLLAVNSAVGLAGAIEDRKRGARDLWLEAGRCPCCGYVLDPEQAGVERPIKCSECGAAWPCETPPSQPIVLRGFGETGIASGSGVVAGDVTAHDHGPYRVAAQFVRKFPIVGEAQQDEVRPLAG